MVYYHLKLYFRDAHHVCKEKTQNMKTDLKLLQFLKALDNQTLTCEPVSIVQTHTKVTTSNKAKQDQVGS